MASPPVYEFYLSMEDGYSIRSIIESHQQFVDNLIININRNVMTFYSVLSDSITRFTYPLVKMLPGYFAYEQERSYQVNVEELGKQIKPCTKNRSLIFSAYVGVNSLFIQIVSNTGISDTKTLLSIDMQRVTFQHPPSEVFSWKGNLSSHITTSKLKSFVSEIRNVAVNKNMGKISVHRYGISINPITTFSAENAEKQETGIATIGNTSDNSPLYVIEITEMKLKWFIKFSKLCDSLVLLYLPTPQCGMLNINIAVGCYAEFDIILIDEKSVNRMTQMVDKLNIAS